MGSDPDYKNTLSLIASLMTKPEIKDAWFNNKEVKLDGFRFVGCRFDNCKLTVSSVNFEIENCHIDATTQILYSGEIIKPIRLFNSRYDWVYQHAPFFAPTKNADGTITIKS